MRITRCGSPGADHRWRRRRGSGGSGRGRRRSARRTAGVGSAWNSWVPASFQCGGSGAPLSTHAACRAAPSATYSPGGGTTTGRPRTAGAIRRSRVRAGAAADQQHPLRPGALRDQGVEAVGQPAQQPLDRGAGQVSPGSRSPAAARAAPRWRPAGSASARPRGTARGRARPRPRGRPGRAATSSAWSDAEHPRGGVEHPGGVERAHQRAGTGRWRRRSPATIPDGSAAGTSATANTVPEVPIETTTSPGSAPTPSAAAMLSPVPGPRTAPTEIPGTPRRPGRLDRAEHPRQHGVVAERSLQQVAPVLRRSTAEK